MTGARKLEYLASITTLLGMYVGSTTKVGVLLYIPSTIVWWWLMVKGRLWGLLPLNAGGLVVITLNFIKVFG